MTAPRNRIHSVLLLTAVMLVLFAHPDSAGQLPPADLVLRNGKIVTMDHAMLLAEAVAVRGDRVIAVGTEAEIRPCIGGTTKVIDLNGQLAIPGFIEGHAHLLSLGYGRMWLDLARAGTWDEIVAMVRQAARTAKPGAWIVGRGWHQEKSVSK